MKRKSLADDLTPSPDPTLTTEARSDVAETKLKPVPDRQHTSIYIPRAAYERLREIAHVERVKIHDLVMDGIDRVIADRGHPERALKHRSTKTP